jgi:hypothetical protein
MDEKNVDVKFAVLTIKGSEGSRFALAPRASDWDRTAPYALWPPPH